jgi:hypothetical protein
MTVNPENLPPTGARRPESLPAPATEGLSALDRDRAGTLADEGGVSAATVEAREPFDIEAPLAGPAWRTAALLAAGALGVLIAWSVLGRRSR